MGAGFKSMSSTSKLQVSVGDENSGWNGGVWLVRLSQSIPRKKGCFLKSSTPLLPNLSPASQTNLWKRHHCSFGCFQQFQVILISFNSVYYRL